MLPACGLPHHRPKHRGHCSWCAASVASAQRPLSFDLCGEDPSHQNESRPDPMNEIHNWHPALCVHSVSIGNICRSVTPNHR